MDRKLYLGILGSLFVVSTLWLSLFKENRIDMYIAVFIACYFASTAVLNPKKNRLDVAGVVLFVIFCVIVAINIISTISRINM